MSFEDQVKNLEKALNLYNKNIMEQTYRMTEIANINEYTDFTASPATMIFITKPNCTNIIGKIGNSFDEYDNQYLAFLPELRTTPRKLREELIFGGNAITSPFIHLLNNSIDLQSISPVETSLNTRDGVENRYGVHQIYGGNVIQNMAGSDLGLTFRDVNHTNIGNSLITQLMKAWLHYIEAVTFGSLSPGKPYTVNAGEKGGLFRAINYASSIYFFKLAPDGKTIIYWGKWTGVFPKSVSTGSVFSGGDRDVIKIPVSFQTQFYEDLNIDILGEFNMLNAIATGVNKGEFIITDKIKDKDNQKSNGYRLLTIDEYINEFELSETYGGNNNIDDKLKQFIYSECLKDNYYTFNNDYFNVMKELNKEIQ